jgi:hypothetical protein
MQNPMRPVLSRILVVLLIFTFVTGTACSLPAGLFSKQQSPVVETDRSGEEQNSINSGEAGDDGVEVRFQEEGFEPPRYPSPKLGSISFTADTAASMEREITPVDEQVEMQVVDSAGLTWSLSIPRGALESTQTIKMVPLSGLDSNEISGPVGEVIGGVRLEPDGITFRKPVSLSVNGPALQGPTFILSGTHTGADIDYTLQDTAATEPSARILHFSTYFASQPQSQELADAQKQAWQEYQQLVKEAKKLLKSSPDVPTPPSIPLECPDAETGQKNGEVIKKFIENALNPENDLIARMLIQRTRLALVGDTQLGENWDIENALVNRIAKKAVAMMAQYSGREEKLVAVSEFAIKAARQLALLSGDQAVIADILNGLANWNSALIDKLIKDIKNNHNYKKIPVVWMIAYNAELLGAGNDVDSFLEKLKDALRFEVVIHLDVHLPDINNITEAVVPVEFDPNSNNLYSCSAQGQGSYLLAKIDDPDFTVETPSYPVRVVIKEFDPCNGTVIIGVDRFGSDGDTMTFTTEDGSETHPWPISRDSGISLYDDELKNGMFWFELTVENGSATAVDETIERTRHEVVNGELTIKLIHK